MLKSSLIQRIRHRLGNWWHSNFSSPDYWEQRYQRGLNSGAGSYGRLAEFKAKFLNAFVSEHSIQNVLELGVGDGHQLSLAKYPHYCGIDVSETAIKLCRTRFANDPTKVFFTTEEDDHRTADLVMSLDVLYHLVEQSIFDRYLTNLFSRSTRYVIVYAANRDDNPFFDVKHVKFRKFTSWVESNCPDWKLESMAKNEYPYDPKQPDETSFADFYVFSKSAP
jgi:2-polyprenyl-3-methyl-5-hydroxy-6-metoxy-1,4-benzoquinol methylase